MSSSMINYVENYTPQVLILLVALLAIVSIVFFWVWSTNKKKYHNLKHQIPANVVKNYLDSIIQNSTSLKSSLFRGGGLDIDPNSVPSVLPLKDLAGSAPVAGGGASQEELNAANAEIARLRAEVGEKQNTITELEKLLAEAKANAGSGDGGASQDELDAAKVQIIELENQLADAKANAGSGEGGADPAELASVSKERDEYKEKLEEYAIIEDDLANLKRLQQENEQLKKSLAEGGGAPPPAAEPEPAAAAPEPEPAPVEEAAPEPEPVEAAAPAEEAPIVDVPDSLPDEGGDEKSPEDLLSEFEKMLG